MRILHVVPSYLPARRYGGTITSVHGLCKGLARAGHDVHVFTTDRDGPGRLEVPLGSPVDVEGVHVWYFPVRRLRRLFWAPPLAAALRREVASFDLLHLHSVYLWPTAVAAHVARRSGTPYILTPRGMLVPALIERKSAWAKKAWIALVERRNLERAAGVHFTSRLEAEDAARLGFRLSRSFVLPNGVDAHGAGAPDGDGETRTGVSSELLYIGRVNWKKGLDRVLRALALLPQCRLTIVGNDEEGYAPKLEALAAELGVAARVNFAGALYGEEKRAHLERAAALVLASYSENFGNVVLEAMAAACPVVVTPEVGAAELVVEADAGVVVEGEPARLAQAIATLVADPEARARMGRNGKLAVAARYSWDAVAARMAETYRGIVSRPYDVAAECARC